MAVKRFPYLLGHGEIASLYEVERQTSQLWKTRGVLGEPDIVISGNPYWLLPTVLGLAEDGAREVSPERLKEYKAGIADGYTANDSADLPPIVGLKEIPWIFGKKYMDVYQWRVRRSFVPEDAMISGSPLWLLDTVLQDAEQRGRAIVQEGIDRIRAGEREQIKPRGRKPSAEPKPTPPPLPEARTFRPGEHTAQDVAAFAAELLDSGLSLTVRPKR
ncbi:hypothetical protein [Streptomyces flaveus]|uniref:Uncharacterized protein n=1 Tax=Streptomyces flaveus TaxID=66370 RepID=A0A917REH7_9ACTN|nr:hypothetical protein [Streptomyces flaveus]GGL03450.1 hypothetical protein GCM10010094_75450 [Streptomyces flaveus]